MWFDCANSYAWTNFNICSEQGSFCCLVFVQHICSTCLCVLLCTWFFVAVLLVSVFFFFLLNKVGIVVCASGCCTTSHPFVAGLATFDSMNPWFVIGTGSHIWQFICSCLGAFRLFEPLFLVSVVHWHLLSLYSFTHPCVLHWLFLVKVPYLCLNLRYIVCFLPRFWISSSTSVLSQLVWGCCLP